jgi:poly(hydroxyalkanoate) depolymerase family esterase
MIVAIANTMLFAQTGSMQIDGIKRDYLVYVPSAGIGENPPLILALHALGQTNTQFRTSTGWDKIADREKFVVVYPVGITKVNMQGQELIGWDISGESDVKFITALIDTLAGRHKINRKRVYSTGFSMGGMMSYVLACRQSEKIAAIGPDAGYPVGQNASSCKPAVPVPVCHIHGGKDDFVKYSDLPPWIKKFADVNKCQASPRKTSGNKYTKEDYTPCEGGNDVLLYTITDMAHEYATSSRHGFSATDTIWTFFSTHPGVGTATLEPKPYHLCGHSISAQYGAGTISLKHSTGAIAARLFDTQGRKLGNWNSIAGQNVLNTTPLPAGVYLLSVSQTEGEVVLCLTVQ